MRSYGQPPTQAPGSLANIATLRLPPAVMLHDQDYEDHRSEELYDAAARGDLRHVHELLEEGVDPDWCSPVDGLTPLHIAATKGRAECLLRLLRAGADIYATGAAVAQHSTSSSSRGSRCGFGTRCFRVAATGIVGPT